MDKRQESEEPCPDLQVLLADQRARWMRGELVPCEYYFLRYPVLAADAESALDFIGNELLLRLEIGEQPSLQEFQSRFPQWLDQLKLQFEVELAVQAMASHGSRASSTSDSAQELLLTQTSPALPIFPPRRPQAGNAAPQATTIGRYRVTQILGRGGFGIVYLGHDDELNRRVAIKVPRRDLFGAPRDAETFMHEAQIVATLVHPNIVTVFDVGRSEDGLPFVVSRFIEGESLEERLRKSRLSCYDAAGLAARIADALHYAHQRCLVHRDVKPANVLLDNSNTPILVDFGLALREEDFGRNVGLAGTPAYMSPEQAKGEAHRVDGRSDIFSLGVVLYEMLAGRLPFPGQSPAVILEQIISVEVRPPRQLNDGIPRELERICLKALAKRASDRYSTAGDFAADLRHWLSQEDHAPTLPGSLAPSPPASEAAATPSSQRPLQVIPKGLRSFDASDAEFFLELLPGPRDRDGLPDCIRRWKLRIEERDAGNTFTVGLIYGPSGSGKSSLVKAGLLPHLAPGVIVIYLEASTDDTELRLLNGLRKHWPALPELPLKETLTALRRGQGIPNGNKVLIVLDQFEQWLHANKHQESAGLTLALRQCDGARIQCLLLVRDDFWMAIVRFMHALEISLLEGANSTAIDLFPVRHAEKVLAAFGRAFGSLADISSQEQKEFLNQAVAGLAEDEKVICVRLALFAEMMRGKAWTPATLKAVGGAEAIGVAFLEETFSATTAPPENRYHQKAARAVLRTLLPGAGQSLRGHMRERQELLEACGYASRPKDFEALLRILDGQLRLIMPADPEGLSDAEPAAIPAGAPHYQLTHDYLVRPLRDWLARKQKETRRGRAELLLADQAAVWQRRQESRQLPSLLQWLRIRWHTAANIWTAPQRQMMHKAFRHHALRLGLAVAALALLALGCWEAFGRWEARRLHDRVLEAETVDLPGIIRDMAGYRRWVDPLLRAQAGHVKDGRKQLHLSLALLPVDLQQVEYLYGRLLKAEPQEVMVICDALVDHRHDLTQRLWAVLENPGSDQDERLRAAGALARWAPADGRWQRVRADVAGQLVGQSAFAAGWADVLQPIGKDLLGPLALFIQDEARSRSEVGLIARLYQTFAREELEAFLPLENVLLESVEPAQPMNKVLSVQGKLSSADSLDKKVTNSRCKIHPIHLQGGKTYTIELMSDQFDPYLRLLDPAGMPLAEDDDSAGGLDARIVVAPASDGVYGIVAVSWDGGIGAYRLSVTVGPAPPSKETELSLARRQANVAVALLAMGKGEKIWPLFKHGPNPTLRSYLIDRLAPAGLPPKTMLRRLEQELEPSVKQAIVLALGEYGLARLSRTDRDFLLPQFVALYRDHPNAEVHAAADWLIRQWQGHAALDGIDRQLAGNLKSKCRWCISRSGQTLVILPKPAAWREKPNAKGLPGSSGLHFAIGSKLVTVNQFRSLMKRNPSDKAYSPTDDCPVTHVSWFDAAQFCNALSAREGIDQEEWCYLPNQDGKYAAGMQMAPNFLQREGYRLPTEMEWELACRAGTGTRYSFGDADELLAKYGWYDANSYGTSHPTGALRPNGYGLFDMHGNVNQWCQDAWRGTKTETDSDLTVAGDVSRVLRGLSFKDEAWRLRSANSYQRRSPRDAYGDYGFRVARTMPALEVATGQ